VSDQSLTMESLGEPFFTSRSSQIFVREDNRLLKLFNREVDPELIRNEEINTTEAFEKGVSLVKCYGRVRVGDRTGLLIERISGKTLISNFASHPGSLFGVPGLMARLQIRLHATATQTIRCYKDMVRSALDSPPLSFLSAEEKGKALEKLEALPDGDSILHLDYHPDNIMTFQGESSIIDWMTAARGAPAADVAATLYLLTEGEMIPGLNRVVAAILEGIRKGICRGYLKNYKRISGMTDEEIACWRLPFLIVRLGVWHIASEIQVLQEKIRTELAL